MATLPSNPLGAVGAGTIGFLSEIGRIATFAGRGAMHAFAPPIFLRELMKQLLRIGYASIPVVGLTAVFTGAALALNIYTGGERSGVESFLPQIVGVAITRELGPVLAALMLAGRVSAAIAAEIGTMRVTEQVDALTTLSVNPFKYLIGPRLAAATFTLPLLVGLADIIGIMGGWLVSVYALDFNGSIYITNVVDFVTFDDVFTGLIKAAVFGFLLALMGCYHGYYSRGGAQGVGRSTTNAVVSAAILIFASNYLLTTIFVEA
ncbi:MAG: ABC transporter permease [Pseudomonadota bacterium]